MLLNSKGRGRERVVLAVWRRIISLTRLGVDPLSTSLRISFWCLRPHNEEKHHHGLVFDDDMYYIIITLNNNSLSNDFMNCILTLHNNSLHRIHSYVSLKARFYSDLLKLWSCQIPRSLHADSDALFQVIGQTRQVNPGITIMKSAGNCFRWYNYAVMCLNN